MKNEDIEKKYLHTYIHTQGRNGFQKVGWTMGWVASEVSLFSWGVGGGRCEPPENF